MTFKLSVIVGPLLVPFMAAKFAEVPGVVITVQGIDQVCPDRVYLEYRTFPTSCVSDDFLLDVRNTHHATFGLTWRNIYVLGVPMSGPVFPLLD